MVSPSGAPNERLRGLVALGFVQVFFGLFPIFGKWAFVGFEPRAVAGWRIVCAALAMGSVAFAIHGRRMWTGWGDLARLQVYSLLGVVANMVLFLEGLERSTAVNAGLIMPTIPIFTFAIAVALKKEPFLPMRGLGIAVAFGGAMLLLVPRGADLDPSHRVGNLLMVTNAFCYSVYLVLLRPLLGRHPPLVVAAWTFLLAAWTIPFVSAGADWRPEGVELRSWLSLGYVVVFPTIVAYLMNLYALARVSSSTTATWVFVQPLIATTGGVLLLGEALPSVLIGAAAAILSGLWLVVRRPAARPAVPADSRPAA